MKRLIITFVLPIVMLTENLGAIRTAPNDSTQSGSTTIPTRVHDEFTTVNLESGDVSTGIHTLHNPTLEFERSYYDKYGKVAFIFQRISRFTKFACMTTSSILSAFAIWNEENAQNATAYNTTAIVVNVVGIVSAGIDIYATQFLKEAEALH